LRFFDAIKKSNSHQMLYNKDKGSTRKKLGRFFSSISDRFSMDITDLIRAVDKNDTETVVRAMNAGFNPDEQDGINRRALPMAIDNLNEVMIQALLRAGANPDLPGMDGETALYKAVTWGHEPIVKMLLDAGANPTLAIAAGTTPLQEAKRRGSQSMLQLLTNPKASKPKPEKSVQVEEQTTRIASEVSTDLPPVIKKQRKPSPKTQQQQAAVEKNIALAEKTAAEAKKLEAKVKAANAKATKAVKEAKEKAAKLQKELEQRIAKEKQAQAAPAKKSEAKKAAPPKTTTAKTKVPTKTAATTNKKKSTTAKKASAIIPYIKEAGSMAGALCMAITEDNTAALAALLTQIKKADIDKIDEKTGLNPLMLAIEKKNAKATGALIDKGADILTVNAKKGHSPLSMAVSMESYNLVKFMLKKADSEAVKAALNSTDQLLSPQYLSYNKPKMLDLLLAAGADPNFGGREGTSPLLKGLEKGSIGLLPLYAKHDLDMNQLVEGKSLLEWAIKYNRIDWANGLLAEGADTSIKNKNEQTALEYAVSFGDGRTAFVELLSDS